MCQGFVKLLRLSLVSSAEYHVVSVDVRLRQLDFLYCLVHRHLHGHVL